MNKKILDASLKTFCRELNTYLHNTEDRIRRQLIRTFFLKLHGSYDEWKDDADWFTCSLKEEIVLGSFDFEHATEKFKEAVSKCKKDLNDEIDETASEFFETLKLIEEISENYKCIKE